MKKGFTLIELLVSVGIFTVVMTVALGALLAVAESDRKAQTLKTITNNLGFALESMSRAVRTGFDYNCNSPSGGNCQGGGTYFAFTPACLPGFPCPPPQTAYRFNSSCFSSGTGCIERSLQGGAAGTWQTITAPEVVVQDLKFYLVGAPRGDSLQPRVTITAVGYVQVSELQRSEFRIQTAVTQRLYDR